MDRTGAPKDIDPIEFKETIDYATEVAHGALSDEINLPPIDGDFEFESEGEAFRLGNHPSDRFGLAAAKKYRGREEDFYAFMMRFRALGKALSGGTPPDLWAPENAIRDSVVGAAAICPMFLATPPDDFHFDPEVLFNMARVIEQKWGKG
jgi:hypothetical protein